MAFGQAIIARSGSREISGLVLTLTTAKNSIITTMSADTTTTTTTNPSRLLALPAELRNKIWEYTMKGGKFFSSHPIHLTSPSLLPQLTIPPPPQTAALYIWTTKTSGPTSSSRRASTSP